MHFTIYKQLDAMDCGPCCLRMVAKHYGKEISLQTFRERTQIGKEGVSLLGISEAAEVIGFRTKSLQLTYDALIRQANLPAILHWRQNHFIILYKVKKGKLYIADPGAGQITLNASEFRSQWISNEGPREPTGIALLLEPSPFFYSWSDEQKQRNKGLRFSNIFKYIMPYKKLLFQLLIGLGLGSFLQLILPFLTKSIVDTGVNNADIHFIFLILLAQLALLAGRMTIEFVRSWILLHISTRINISILTDFIIKLMKLPLAYFDSKHTGDIMQRMNDHSRIESFLTGSSLSIIFSLVNLVIFSIVLAIFNPQIFIVFFIASILYSLWVVSFLKKRRRLDYKRFHVSAKEQGVTIQFIQGMQEIKLNGVEKNIRWSWESLQAKLMRLRMKGLALNQRQQAGAFFIHEGKNILIIFLSAKSVIEGDMTLGSMLAVQYMIGQLNSPVEQIIAFVQSLQNAKISMERLNEIHTMEDEEPVGKDLQQELPPAFARQISAGKMPFVPNVLDPDNNLITGNSANEGSIFFKNVSFTYPGAGNDPVLRDINLEIPKGKTTAIVGVSGSGKTTLLKLLLRFYEPQKGTIKLGTVPFDAISHKVWRSHCGMVMQEGFIFSDTISNNIVMSDDKTDMDRLQSAVEFANIKEFIESLPLGYNTKIGAESTGISMGQRQRILIARAIYRDPGFIFFDEATNSLDANNESVILKKLSSFFRGRTAVVVAHRLSTVKNADQIVVLNKGIITEKGTHQELVNGRGEYYTLIKNQLDLETE
jgi:ATP-binding cassette, subfamily B, bacterial